MQTTEFLRLVLPLSGPDDPRASELIRFCAVSREETFPGTVHWKSRAELHALSETGISALGFDVRGKDCYLSVHGWQRRGKDVTKADSAPTGNVCWLECDDSDLPPETLHPLPSIVVSTSPGRFHAYWLLNEATPIEVIEKINYRLAYGNNLREDRGGWAIGKWLRLPGSVSHKRSEPHPVAVTTAVLDRVYSVEDFDDLPEAPELVLSGVTIRDVPSVDLMPDREDILSSYSIPSELRDLLDRQRSDRSAALWRMYSLCYQAGLSEEEAYAVIVGSPNDKFTNEWRYNAKEGLWRDVCRGFRMTHSPGETPILTTLTKIRAQSGTPASDRRWLISQAIRDDLNEHGRIYFDEQRHDAVYYDGKQLIPMDLTNRRWKSLLNITYRVVESEPEFRPVNANLYAIASNEADRVTPRTGSYWDRDRHVLYVYNGAGKVFRLDGEEHDGDPFEIVDNGTDGVMFRDVGFEEPVEAVRYQYSPSHPDEPPTLDEAIFGLPNYEDNLSHHTYDQATRLAKLWVYSLFFAEQMDARPHLVINGPTDSGKTLLLQAISELLAGEGSTVSSVPTSKETFETVISNARHVFFDNVDSSNRWLEDSLCEVATGIQFTRRVLYTTNDHVTFKVQCNIGITSRNNWFSRTDVANRLVVLYVERREMKLSPTALLDRIRVHRSHLWWEMLNDLNKIIVGLWDHKPSQHTLRMAAYADFVQAACSALDMDCRGLLATIEGNQRGSALDHSVLWQCLDAWVRRQKEDDRTQEMVYVNNGQWITTTRLHTALRNVSEDVGCRKDYERQISNTRSLSQQLRELVPDIKNVMDVEFKQSNPSNKYKFSIPEHVQLQEVA